MADVKLMAFNKISAKGKIPVQYQREQAECCGYICMADLVPFLPPLYQYFRLDYLDTIKKKRNQKTPGLQEEPNLLKDVVDFS